MLPTLIEINIKSMNSALIILLAITMNISFLHNSDCSDAVGAADDATSNLDQALNSNDIEELKDYIQYAISSLEEAMDYSDECGCEEAYSSADDGLSKLRSALDLDDLDDIISQVESAKRNAEDAVGSADDCDNE